MNIRLATRTDADQIAAIYNHYVTDTVISFDEDTISTEEMGQRINSVQDLGLPWLVYETDDKILGYAYANKFRERIAYRFTVESTVYLAPDQFGKGIGLDLYRGLIDGLKQLKLHCVMGCIALPNEASVKLHEKMGFQKMGHFPAVGFKLGQWIDVGYWQLML